jgi:hypothetical protein
MSLVYACACQGVVLHCCLLPLHACAVRLACMACTVYTSVAAGPQLSCMFKLIFLTNSFAECVDASEVWLQWRGEQGCCWQAWC